MITVTYYTASNQEHIILVQHINGPTINPKNSHKDLKGVLEINFTTLQKYIKIIPIKYAVKYITLQLYIITIVKIVIISITKMRIRCNYLALHNRHNKE